jgi:hypothetical protein
MNNNLKWTSQQISLTFIEEHPNLYLNPSKIKQHLKHLQLKQKNDGNDMNIVRNENTKDPIDNI